MQFNSKVIDVGDEAIREIATRDRTEDPLRWNGFTWALARMAWKSNRRPYIHVWPAVERALLRTKIEGIDPYVIPPSIIHELLAIEVRFSDSSGRNPFMLSITEKRKFTDGHENIAVAVTSVQYNESRLAFKGNWIPFGQPLSFATQGNQLPFEMQDELKLSIGIMLLAADSSHCKPMILNRDQNRELTGGDLNRAIERARRNGKFGFDIGKDIEVSPHYRRPHFAIRWTGEKGKTPRLVPIKGSIINKSTLDEIPTGYEDDEK